MVAETNALGKAARHLQQLKRALESENVTGTMDSPGGARIALQIPGLAGDVTCRANPRDASHWWYWHDNTPFAAAGDAALAREAATELLKLRSAQVAH